jgi:hypothetical protein
MQLAMQKPAPRSASRAAKNMERERSTSSSSTTSRKQNVDAA